MSTHYIADNSKELFEQAPDSIKSLIKGGEVNDAAKALGAKYNIQIGFYQRLSNIISFTIIGAIQPNDVVLAIVDGLKLSEEEATSLAKDMESTILEKARSITLGKEEPDTVVLKFEGQRSPDELRKEILDTTKRESALVIPQTSGVPKKPTAAAPGSRSQLLEQLQILSAIPNDAEVEERLGKIQEQINSIKKKEDDNLLDSKIALKSFMFGEKGKEVVEAKVKTATYSAPPTHYNLDPYRELTDE